MEQGKKIEELPEDLVENGIQASSFSYIARICRHLGSPLLDVVLQHLDYPF